MPAGQVSRLAAQWEKRQEGTAGPAHSRSLSHAAAMHRYAASALENRARTLQWLAAARPGGQVGCLRLAGAVLQPCCPGELALRQGRPAVQLLVLLSCCHPSPSRHMRGPP